MAKFAESEYHSSLAQRVFLFCISVIVRLLVYFNDLFVPSPLSLVLFSRPRFIYLLSFHLHRFTGQDRLGLDLSLQKGSQNYRYNVRTHKVYMHGCF